MTTKRKLLPSDSEEEEYEDAQSKPSKGQELTSKSEKKEKQQEPTESEDEDEDEVLDSSESESDEDEDENGDLLTADVDAKILTTIATIKARDPAIYTRNVKFFDVDSDARSTKFATDQADIKDELKRAFYDQSEDDEQEGGLVMAKKVKSREELEQEEKDYKEFLLQNLKSNPNAQQAMQDWIAYGNQNADAPVTLSADDKFLVDYIMSRGWIEKLNSNEHRVESMVKEAEVSEEEVDRAEAFEESYNFRHESSQSANIITHPRDISDSMRRKDSKRRKERDLIKQRKEQEKAKQREELERLKNARREELMMKAEKLIRVSGTDAAKRLLEEECSDSEIDFDEHDKKMSTVFGDDYYDEEDEEGVGKDFKEDDDDNNENDNDNDNSPVLETKSVRKISKHTKTLIPEDIKRTIEEKLHKLDYEDRIGDIQCRFKYRQVPQSSFGLDIHELLTADDKSLNEHVPLRKLAPYLPEKEQLENIKKYGDKRRVWKFRNNHNHNNNHHHRHHNHNYKGSYANK